LRLRCALLISITLGLNLLPFYACTEDLDRSKATYLYQLSRFVQWPEFEPQQVFFSVCLYKSDSLKPILQEAQGRKIEGRPFRVVTIHAFEDVASCQILFARHLDGKAFQAVFKAIKEYPVLFCSDAAGFSELGGTLEFKSIGEAGVNIAINVDSVKRSGLLISANLMEMVEQIYSREDSTPSTNSPLPVHREKPLTGET
jgi:uncharacterized protein YunC (DUF1805 family)